MNYELTSLKRNQWNEQKKFELKVSTQFKPSSTNHVPLMCQTSWTQNSLFICSREKQQKYSQHIQIASSSIIRAWSHKYLALVLATKSERTANK